MSFVRNARLMLIGFAIAQALPLLASPLLSRLFSPEAFGLQTLFVSSTSVLLVLATLRMDLATVLAVDRREAMQIVSLAVLQASSVAALLLGTIAFVLPVAMGSWQHPIHVAWAWAIAPMVLVLALVQIASGLLTWLRHFGPASQAQVVNQASYLAVAIGLGFWASPTSGLVAAKLIGQMIACAVLMYVLRGVRRDLRIPSREDWPGLWDRCRPFLIFNTPYSLVGALGREVPVFAFAAFAATSAAGYYGLARTLLGAPATLLAASLSQVFYREAAEHRGTPHLQRLTFALLQTSLTAAAPAFAFVMVWGDFGFAELFGARWETAGTYAMILAFPAWLGLQTAWPERLYESVGRQGVSFAIQITFDAVTALLVFGTTFAGLPALLTVSVFAAINSLFHLSYLTGMIRVAGFPATRLVTSVGKGLVVLSLSVAVMIAGRMLIGASLVVFLAECAGTILAVGALAFQKYPSISAALRSA